MPLDPIDEAKVLLSGLPEGDQRTLLEWLRQRYPIHPLEGTWGAPAEVILEAIARASSLSHRGVLGLIAEASFKVNVIDQLDAWTATDIVGDAPFDFCITREGQRVRIQVKRQRMERGEPKRFRTGSTLFAVETQRTRTGTNSAGASTRPYRFGEFDILAVSMQPATDDWASFRFAPQRWLLPRPGDTQLLRVMQPVSLRSNGDWTDNLIECIDRLCGTDDHRVAET